MLKGYLFFSLTLVLVACAAPPPTKVYEKGSLEFKTLTNALARPIDITDQVVLIDARAPFDYAVVHAPGAVNVQWSDFTQRGPFLGLLKPDTSSEARRLARMGIGPDTPVVILDSGVNGMGEGGRLAWTLLYYGIQNVQVAQFDKVGLRFSNITPEPRAGVTYWAPSLIADILIQRRELLKKLKGPRETGFYILDVRSKAEYFSKNKRLDYEVPDLGALNIHWKEFFGEDGRPNPKIKSQLRAVGVGLNDQIIVISNNGLRSGAVTYALLSMGFRRAANFSGGYSELLKR